MNYILNGQAHGDVASRLMACDFDAKALRPYEAPDGRVYITQNVNGVDRAIPIHNTTTTLRKDDWIQLDAAIVKAAKPRLKAVGDLRGRGLTYTIPNGMGKTVLQTETMSDVGPASVSMDGLREGNNDRPVFELTNLPLPIVHKDFSFSSRQIQASRNGGSPLDTTSAELAARTVAEEVEKLLLGVSTVADQYSFGGGVIYGYTDFPNRLTQSITAPTTSDWTGATLLGEVLEMKQSSMDAYHYGPWMLYVSPAWDQYLDDDFKAASDKTVRQRIKEIAGIEDIQTLDYLPTATFDIVLVQLTTNVVREVVGMEMMTVEWDSHGGLLKNYKVMAIMVPQIRADQNSNTGIVHGNTSL